MFGWLLVSIRWLAVNSLSWWFIFGPLVLTALTVVCLLAGLGNDYPRLEQALVWSIVALPLLLMIGYIVAFLCLMIVGEDSALLKDIWGFGISGRAAALYFVSFLTVSVVFFASLFAIAATRPNAYAPPIDLRTGERLSVADVVRLREGRIKLAAYQAKLLALGSLGDVLEHFEQRPDFWVLKYFGIPSTAAANVANVGHDWLWVLTFFYRTFCGLLAIRILWQGALAIRHAIEGRYSE